MILITLREVTILKNSWVNTFEMKRHTPPFTYGFNLT